MERLDKVLSNLGYGTRKEVKKLVKNEIIEVDGKRVKDSSLKINPQKNKISINGTEVNYLKKIYIMLNKPSGVVSATYDKKYETVIDLIDEKYYCFKPFPVGRLDIDTVGLLLITNDGMLNHKLISPKYHVEKVYYAKINKKVDLEDVKAFENGIVLDDGYKCMPSKLNIINSSENESEVEVSVFEGKFHQIKRMFIARGKKVTFLKRIKFGGIKLDENLEEGEYRLLTEQEIKILKDV